MSKSEKRDFAREEKEALQAFLDQEVKEAGGKPLNFSGAKLQILSSKLAELREDGYARTIATLSAHLHRRLRPKEPLASDGNICDMVAEVFAPGAKKIAKKLKAILRANCKQTRADKREIKSLRVKVRKLEVDNKNLLAMRKKLQKLEAAVIEFKQVENNEGLSGLVKRIKKIEAAVEATA